MLVPHVKHTLPNMLLWVQSSKNYSCLHLEMRPPCLLNWKSCPLIFKEKTRGNTKIQAFRNSSNTGQCLMWCPFGWACVQCSDRESSEAPPNQMSNSFMSSSAELFGPARKHVWCPEKRFAKDGWMVEPLPESVPPVSSLFVKIPSPVCRNSISDCQILLFHQPGSRIPSINATYFCWQNSFLSP